MIARLAAALCGALLLAAPIAPATAAPPADPSAGGAQPGGPERSITLESRSPWVPAEGTLRIDLLPGGDVDPLAVRLRIHQPVESMEELEESLDGSAGPVVYRMPQLPVGFLASQPDGSRRIELAVSETDSAPFTARLRRPGVYPVSIDLEDDSGEVIDTIRTPLVRLGTADDPLPSPGLALVVELAAPPTIEPDGRRDLDDDELDRLSRLAALLASTGADGSEVDLSVSVSPDTVEALTASADARAVDVLAALADTAGDRTALTVPYVPLDPDVLAAAGLGAFVAPITAAGLEVLRDRIGAEVVPAVWGGALGTDLDAAALLADLGIELVLVSAAEPASETSPAAERTLVDAGPVELPGASGLGAVVVDVATSDALAERAADRADAAHLALAELLLRAPERTSSGDGEEPVVALRVDDVADDSVLARLLPLLADHDSPIDVGPLPGAVVDGRPADGEEGDEPVAGADDPGAPVIELDDPDPQDRAVALLTEAAETVANAWVAVDIFAGLLGTESARAEELRLRIATALADGVSPDRRVALLEAVADATTGAFDAVTITGQTDVNLTSRRGTLPLVLRNENPFPVDVVVRIRSERLLFPEGERFEIEVGPDPVRLDVPIEARATGSVPTFVELLTPDERLVLDERRLDVRSTAVSGVGLAISLGALLVLVVWWFRTYLRDRRSR